VQGFPSFTTFDPGGLSPGGLESFVLSPGRTIADLKDLTCTELCVAYLCAIQAVIVDASPSSLPELRD
jgi:hypothetical protein